MALPPGAPQSRATDQRGRLAVPRACRLRRPRNRSAALPTTAWRGGGGRPGGPAPGRPPSGARARPIPRRSSVTRRASGPAETEPNIATTILPHTTAEGPQDRAAWRQLLTLRTPQHQQRGPRDDPGVHRKRRTRDHRDGRSRELGGREGGMLRPSEQGWRAPTGRAAAPHDGPPHAEPRHGLPLNLEPPAWQSRRRRKSPGDGNRACGHPACDRPPKGRSKTI